MLYDLNKWESLPLKNQAWKILSDIDASLFDWNAALARQNMPAVEIEARDKNIQNDRLNRLLILKYKQLIPYLIILLKENIVELPNKSCATIQLFIQVDLNKPEKGNFIVLLQEFYHLWMALIPLAQTGEKQSSTELWHNIMVRVKQSDRIQNNRNGMATQSNPILEPSDDFENNPNWQIDLLLHNIRSAHNVGNMIRSMACFGFSSVYASGYTADDSHQGVKKTAMGAQHMVKFSVIDDCKHFLTNYPGVILGLENDQSAVDLKTIDLKHLSSMSSGSRVLLMPGNEEFGLEPWLQKFCHQLIYIPTTGQKSSLNVSNALAICLYQLDQLTKR